MAEDIERKNESRDAPALTSAGEKYVGSTDTDLHLDLMYADLSPHEKEYMLAKAYFLSATSATGQNLFGHIKSVINKLLDEKPKNAVDIFEDISYEVKKTHEAPEKDLGHVRVDRSTHVALAEIEGKLFTRPNMDEEAVFDEETVSPLQNLLELSHFFKLTGVGLGQVEMLRVALSLKKFLETIVVTHIRFWGKIFGVEQSYYVIEVTIDAEEDEEEIEEEEDEENKEKGNDEEEDLDFDEPPKVDEIPKPNYHLPPEVPKEDKGFGPNKKTYFVCNDPGKLWQKLPLVTPGQIVAARQIRRLMTGRLEAPVISFPSFPGNEGNYLRAQIARITAGTHISPLGFYSFGDDENEDESEQNRDFFEESAFYKEHFKTANQLVERNLINWVHHEDYILPQGRCVWHNAEVRGEEEEDMDEEDEDALAGGSSSKEVGPPLLNPVSKDSNVGEAPPWTPMLSLRLVPKYALAVMRSTLWPGAYAFAHEEKCENVYVGWGLKYVVDNHDPWLGPRPMAEYPKYLEPEEAEDPTVEEEAAELALRAALNEMDDADDNQEDDEEYEDD